MGWWPSWKEFIDDLKNFEQKLSDYEIRTVKDLEKIQGRHPIIVGVILRWALGNLDRSFSDISQNIIDRFSGGGNDQDLSDAIINYLKKIEDKGEEQYEKTGQILTENFDIIKNNMAKEDTVFRIQEILTSTREEIGKKLDDLVENMKAEQEAKSRPFLITGDVDKLGLVQKEKIEYIARGEDEKIMEYLGRSNVVIRGQAGAGKSSLLYKTLPFIKKDYNNFVLILDFFREDSINFLDQKLQQMDNFVLIWDNLHQKKKELVENTIKQIEKMASDKHKNFRFIGLTRSCDDFSFGAKYLDLERFEDTKIVQECSTIFGIKLDGIGADDILKKSDGTPYYVISLFEQLKAKHRDVMKKEDLENLPDDVISLWKRYIQECNLEKDERTAFQIMALAYHALKRPLEASDIVKVYEKVFNKKNEPVEISLDNLVGRSLLSYSKPMYYTHDSHVDALEEMYPIPERFVSTYVKESENEDGSLWNLGRWADFRKLYSIELECFDKIIESNPNDANALNNKGIALANLGKNEEAIQCCDKALEIEPKNAYALYNKGAALANLGKNEEAIQWYDKVLEIEPEDADVLNNKGAALANLGKNEEAIQCCDKVLEIEPEDADALYNKGAALANLGKNEEAIQWYDKVLEIEPKNARALNNKGLALFYLGKNEEAIQCCDKVLEIEPKNADALNNKGLALANLGKYDKAIQCCDKVLEIVPKNALALYNKGLALYYLGKYDKAIQCCDKVLEIEPKNARAFYNKGLALANLGKNEEAIQWYDKVLEIEPEDADALNNKGLALANLGRHGEAIECYGKSLEINPNYADACYNKSCSESLEGSKQEALNLLEHAINLDPEYKKMAEADKNFLNIKDEPRFQKIIR